MRCLLSRIVIIEPSVNLGARTTGYGSCIVRLSAIIERQGGRTTIIRLRSILAFEYLIRYPAIQVCPSPR